MWPSIIKFFKGDQSENSNNTRTNEYLNYLVLPDARSNGNYWYSRFGDTVTEKDTDADLIRRIDLGNKDTTVFYNGIKVPKWPKIVWNKANNRLDAEKKILFGE